MPNLIEFEIKHKVSGSSHTEHFGDQFIRLFFEGIKDNNELTTIKLGNYIHII